MNHQTDIHRKALLMQQDILSKVPEEIWKPHYAGIPWMDNCPFCGKEPVFKDEIECWGHGDYSHAARVICSKCGATGPSFDDIDFPIVEMRRNMAICAWNNRKKGDR